MKLIKLGTIVCDKASKQSGMLTHANFDSSHQLLYCFQPRGINPDTGSPVKATWISAARADKYKPGDLVEVDVPLGIIGSDAIDDASGFQGMITGLTLHINGCVHADITPRGLVKGELVPAHDFDIRRLSGKHPILVRMKRMTSGELEQSRRDRPSPAATPPKPR